MGKRLNIGLMIDDFDSDYSRAVCKGADMAAESIGANLFILPIGYMEEFFDTDEMHGYKYQYSVLYKYITDNNVDIIYITMGTIGTRTKYDDQIRFLKNLPDVKIVTLFTTLDAFSSIVYDNRVGLKDEIEHLIYKHNVKKIGFVSGPVSNNTDARIRLEIYKDTLEKNGITYDDSLVEFGTFESDSDFAVEALLKNNPDIEAIIFANDMMAVSGYRVAQKHNLSIGKDILFAGFDNTRLSVSLLPQLTTVESSPNMLAYKAVMEVNNFLENGEVHLQIPTHFIQRNSCGCEEFEFLSIYKRLKINDLGAFNPVVTPENEEYVPNTINMSLVYEILLEEYALDNSIVNLKYEIYQFIESITEVVRTKDFITCKKRMRSHLSHMIKQNAFMYTSIEKYTNLLTALQFLYFQMMEDDVGRYGLSQLFSSVFLFLLKLSESIALIKEQHMTNISLVTNGITDAVFGFDYKNPESYYKLYEGLKTVGISHAYLYYFKRTIRHKSKIKWIETEKMDLCAYADGEKVLVPPSGERNMTYDMVLNHKFLPEERFTMVFEPLFSERKLYGLFLCQVKRDFYDTVTPMCMQISLAIKSLKLLEKQKAIRDNLETDLLMVQKNYEELDVISNVDSLTKVFNRRGYRAGVKKLTQNPLNDGRIALIMSADMDNLKVINDTYGHDEGDFALCEVSKILIEAYRNSDVIARFGGDEFAAFALVDKKGCIPVFKDRIRKIVEEHNKKIDKPYMIDISTGFCEVVCEADLDSEKCYDEADKLMYQEKRKKKEERKAKDR